MSSENFGPKPKPGLQPNLSLEQLLAQAKESNPILEQQANALLERLRAQNPELFKGVTFEMGPLKDAADAAQKVATDYGGDPRLIKDLTRGRFIVETPEQIVALKKAISEQMQIDSMKDKYQTPGETGYRDINSKIVLPNGHIGEIQVQQKDMMAVNKLTHSLREEGEKIKEAAKAENRPLNLEETKRIELLNQQARQIHDEAARKGGIDVLLSPEEAAKRADRNANTEPQKSNDSNNNLRNDPEMKKLDPANAPATEAPAPSNNLPEHPNDIDGNPGGSDPSSNRLADAADEIGDVAKRSGLVLGVVLGGAAGVIAIAGGAKPAHAMQIAAEAAIDPAETAFALARGDKQGAKEAGAGLAGGAAGAVLGQIIIPVPFLGAAIGGLVGDLAGREIAQATDPEFQARLAQGRAEIQARVRENPVARDVTATPDPHVRPASALVVRTPAEQKVLNDLFGSNNSPKADQRAEKGPGVLFRDNAKNVTDAETRNGPLTAGFTNQADANAGFSLWRSAGLSGPR